MLPDRKFTEYLVCIIFVTLAGKTFGNPSCPVTKAGMTNVHLVPHTHDDVGWLKTVDQYYYGSRKSITWVGVQYILDSVVASLLKYPDRKFIFVETAFFSRWWEEQDDATKARVVTLVENGQLEFVSGGWSMNDEATTHYTAIIDQMTVGLVYLKEVFGDAGVPRATWQIDPFGHSKEQASLFAQMGMDGLFLGRIDHDDFDKRYTSGTMEMVWKASNSLGESSWLFTGILPNKYSAPNGFCFDVLCNDDPIMDDVKLEDYNVDEKVSLFLSEVQEEQGAYITSNLIMTMGDDFQYTSAESWFKNLDKLIKYVNAKQVSGSNVNIMYSTPSCYLDALYASGTTWPTKTDDFFPYASGSHSFWTGYFTSRPTLKGYVRDLNRILTASKQIAALAGQNRSSIIDLAKVGGVLQHHDGITGTEKQHVADDYSLMMNSAIEITNNNTAEGLRILSGATGSAEFFSCPLLNISACPFTELYTAFVVTVYNPIGRSISSPIRIPVSYSGGYTVTDNLGSIVESQLILLPSTVYDIPGRDSTATYELLFLATDIPPLGLLEFKVEANALNPQNWDEIYIHQAITPGHDFNIQNKKISVQFDGETKSMDKLIVQTDKGAKEITLNQDWLYYEGMEDGQQNSGAYIFRPQGAPISFGPVQNVSVLEGPVVSEVQQIWSDSVSQLLRIYNNSDFFEIEWLVGPIHINDGIGKEVITRFSFPEIQTNETFYTDANGREIQKRILNYRETWQLANTENISQNYYPVTSKILIYDDFNQEKAAVLNDRAQGGSSLNNGEMELMVHRRLLVDDGFGVGEALNERAYSEGLVARGKHYVIHSSFATPECDFNCLHRNLAEEILLKPLLTFSSPETGQELLAKTSGLKNDLPNQIRLLTLEPFTEDNQWLLRIENYYEVDEGGVLVSLDIEDLFSDFTVTSIQEVSLGANQLITEVNRLQWQTTDSMNIEKPHKKEVFTNSAASIFGFEPMQIRSFVLNVTANAV